MSRWCVCCFFFTLAFASAHEDPRGEIHPNLFKTANGFRLEYTSDEVGSIKSLRARTFNHELAVVEDRLLEESEFESIVFERRKDCMFYADGMWHRLIGISDSVIVTYHDDGKQETRRVGWPLRALDVEDVAVVGPIVCCLTMKLASDPFPISDGLGDESEDMFGEPDGGLHVHSFSIHSLKRQEPIFIGVPDRIYEFPTCSELEVFEDRVGLAWARYVEDADPAWTRELVLSVWEPGETDITHHVLDPKITWNTHISMAKDEEKLVVAYHDQEEFRGRARIEVRSIPFSDL